MSRRRNRQPTPEEQALWQAVVRHATPLRRDDGPSLVDDEDAPPPPPPPPFEPTMPVTAPPVSRPPVARTAPQAPVTVQRALPGLKAGDTAGIDRRTADRFQRGRMDIQAHLDLHGMTQEMAHGALNRFIESSAAQGRRCVLVITGKGTRGEGVLRRAVPHWLGDARLRPLILSYNNAQPQHGGSGAIYVLLRRRRD